MLLVEIKNVKILQLIVVNVPLDMFSLLLELVQETQFHYVKLMLQISLLALLVKLMLI
jgi:hypothetical protein